MNKDFFAVYSGVKATTCDACETKEFCTNSCKVHGILNDIRQLADTYGNGVFQSEGCQICTDKRGNIKEIFYDSGRGGFSISAFCPACGKKLN